MIWTLVLLRENNQIKLFCAIN